MSPFSIPLRRSIRFRLSLVIALVILAAVIATASAAGMRELRRAADARAEMLEAAASAYSAALAQPLLDGDYYSALEHMRGMRDVQSVIHMALRDSSGRTFAQLGAGASIRARTANLRALGELDLLSADHAEVSMPVVKAGEAIGSLSVLADITDLRQDLLATLSWTAMVALIAIAGGVAIAQFLIARITQPIRELASVMAEVGAKQDFSRRMSAAKRQDETGVLSEAFNGMIGNIRERDIALAKHMETLEQTVEERTRDLRLAKDDAEAANAAKSDFLATMSHEIRTPMNGMMVMAEMLAAADLSSRHRRYAEIITRSGASLLTIINDILDLSKIEAGKLDLEAVPFSPEALAEDVASLFWEKARSKGLELVVYVAPDVPELVIGDPTRVNQVVTNLVNNALKFTEKGGVAIDLSMETKEGRPRLKLAVADTGVGIEQSRIGAIFEAFSQADQSTTRKFGGTGLGLTVCKRLVDAMGGEITVTSAPGKGSTFAVLVELAVERQARRKPVLTSLPVALALTSPMLAGSVEKAFADLGCEPRRIASPREARAGEIVLTQSDLLALSGAAPGALNICLTDVGDNRVDALIRDRIAVDLLPLPLARQALWDLAARALRFDFRGPAALAISPASSPQETFGHLRILAADDNAVNREVLREALLSLGVEATFVANGVEAVEAARSNVYDIVFMDGSMPEMDGFDATKLIRAHEAQTGQPRAHIAALTAQVRGADAEAWAAAGADHHMTKPFTSARLAEALKAAGAHASRRSLSPAPRSNASPPEPAPFDLALIDDEAIAGMQQVAARSGRDVLGKVWRLFLSQAADAVAKLEAAAAEGDAPALARQAHFLKSMSLSSGAARLAAICEDIETDAKAGRTEVFAQVSNVRSLADATCSQMAERLAARSISAAAS